MASTDEHQKRTAIEGKSVLLVEDIPLLQDLTTAMLEALGASVVLAADGRAAVSIASTFCFDLVLMDVRMPEMGGIEATRAIRKLPGYSAAPIVGYTSSDSDDSRLACLDAGMNDVLPKPSSVADLDARLALLLPLPDRPKAQ